MGLTMTLTIPTPAELEETLLREAHRSGLSPAQYSAQTIAQHLAEVQGRRTSALLLEALLDDQNGEQQATGETLIRALEEDRLSLRSLFPPELKGITW